MPIDLLNYAQCLLLIIIFLQSFQVLLSELRCFLYNLLIILNGGQVLVQVEMICNFVQLGVEE